MHVVGGAGVDIEGDAEILEGFLHQVVVFVDECFGGESLLFGADGDGDAVLIRAADVDDVFAFEAEVAHVGIGRQVGARDVDDVKGSVGVGTG